MNSVFTSRNATRLLGLLLLCGALSGCPMLETVPNVDLGRYQGLWYQVAGFPFPPTDNLVGITADYILLDDGTVRVENRGFVGSFDGNEDVIEGIARVVDETTNSKLSVSFPSVFGGLFPGQYWIIELDEENYNYAVVSDSLRFTLFILSRTPTLDQETFDMLIDNLDARGFDTSRIVSIPQQAP